MYRGSYIRTADGTVRPTLAGLLALGTYPQQFFPQLSITFTHYRGTTKASDAAGIRYTDTSVSYTHLTLPTNREV